MIAGLSKAVTLYLAPLLILTAIFLSMFAFLSPAVMLHDRVALLTITPSALLTTDPSRGVDGPSLFLGVLGSCSRINNAAKINCTSPTVLPVYDLSALPDKGPNLSLSAPTAATPVFIAIALSLSVLFFISFTAISFRHKMGEKAATMLDRPLIQHFSAWIGFFGFIIGITSFITVYMWFGNAVEDFNYKTEFQFQGAKLVADTGNAFTMVWVAHAFYAVPVVISLVKVNVKANKAR